MMASIRPASTPTSAAISDQPHEAKEGIKAKSQRGQVGETWWSQRFITVLESFRIGARLQRGLRYARTGQVMDLTVAPGLVTAKVQGTRRTPYKIRIEVDTLTENDWTKVEAQLAAQAGYLARLLAGEMPLDVDEAFATCRLSLFPASTQQVRTSCSCPDWSNPCKHIAASYYLLAERFDEDPFLVFAWRGRPRRSLLTNLRALRAVTPAPPPPDHPRRAGRDRATPRPSQLLVGRSRGLPRPPGSGPADQHPAPRGRPHHHQPRRPRSLGMARGDLRGGDNQPR